jgi:hypothetical protein
MENSIEMKKCIRRVPPILVFRRVKYVTLNASFWYLVLESGGNEEH